MDTLSSSPPHLSGSLWLQANGWDRFPGLVHGFSGRLQNRSAALSQLGAGDFALQTLKQVHGDHIVIVGQPDTRPDIGNDKLEADGLITAQSGILLGIATADCIPVLIVEPEKRLAAALHAGWRGTLKGINVRAVEALATRWGVDPQRLWVALGPAISGCCYEVGRDVGEALCQRWGPGSPSAWQPTGGEKGFLDLRAINLVQLEQTGVPREQMLTVGACTFCASSAFASYRREGPGAGRQLSVIGWRSTAGDRTESIAP